jgi:hypothetical protein
MTSWLPTALEKMSTTERRETHKVVLRESCLRRSQRLARHGRSVDVSSLPDLRLCRPRAVWRKDATFAHSLITNNPVASEMLHIIGDTPVLINPALFETENADARRDWYVQERAAIVTDPVLARRSRGRLRCISRVELLWAPLQKRLVLSAIKIPGTGGAMTITTQTKELAALAAGWSPTFANAKPSDTEFTQEYVAKWTHKLSWSLPFLRSPLNTRRSLGVLMALRPEQMACLPRLGMWRNVSSPYIVRRRPAATQWRSYAVELLCHTTRLHAEGRF